MSRSKITARESFARWHCENHLQRKIKKHCGNMHRVAEDNRKGNADYSLLTVRNPLTHAREIRSLSWSARSPRSPCVAVCVGSVVRRRPLPVACPPATPIARRSERARSRETARAEPSREREDPLRAKRVQSTRARLTNHTAGARQAILHSNLRSTSATRRRRPTERAKFASPCAPSPAQPDPQRPQQHTQQLQPDLRLPSPQLHPLPPARSAIRLYWSTIAATVAALICVQAARTSGATHDAECASNAHARSCRSTLPIPWHSCSQKWVTLPKSSALCASIDSSRVAQQQWI